MNEKIVDNSNHLFEDAYMHVPDYEKLQVLADWFDVEHTKHRAWIAATVQHDLRRMSDQMRKRGDLMRECLKSIGVSVVLLCMLIPLGGVRGLASTWEDQIQSGFMHGCAWGLKHASTSCIVACVLLAAVIFSIALVEAGHCVERS